MAGNPVSGLSDVLSLIVDTRSTNDEEKEFSISISKMFQQKNLQKQCLNLNDRVSGNSRSPPFPRMKASDSRSRIMGMDFFIPFPFPNFGNAFFSFPSRSRIMGMVFFHSLPVPELWEWIFFIPFPFPNCGNGFFNSLPIPEFDISQTGIKTGIGLL